MHGRTLLAGLATSAVALTALTLSTGTAFAAADPDDTTFTPVAADLIGVGSDTSQHAVKVLADAYDAQTPAPTVKLATFAATGGGMITLPGGAINRPVGSGAGKALLFGTGNNVDVDYARSSSAESDAEKSAGLQSFPFALDTLVTVVSGSVKSNAPATIAPADLVKIYNGTYTDWKQLPGSTTTGTIAPKIPQSGSGTRTFFLAQLQAANGGVAVTLGSNVAEVTEQDPAPIQNDANAIAPFSKGRAKLVGTALTVEGGLSADRAIYDVVRGTDVSNADVQKVFGASGFFCSSGARSLIEAAGFQQLATAAAGGVCGAPTQDATSNFTINQTVATTTTLVGSNPSANDLKLVATVAGATGSTTPTGTVDFYYNNTKFVSVPLAQGGQAVFEHKISKSGSFTFTAKYVPATGAAFDASMGDGTVFIKTASGIAETFPASVAKGKTASGVVKVNLSHTASKATGSVKITEGTKVLKTATLSNGAASVALPALTKGTHHLTITFAGDTNSFGSTKAFTIVQK